MKYTIEPVFVIFPLICLLLYYTNIKARKWVHFLLVIFFIFIYAFSLNGSDIDSYRQHYVMVERGVSLSENNQEAGYYYLMKLAISLGIDYMVFRTVFLSVLSLVLFHTIRKLTEDFPLSLFFISSMFVIYTISAYRQYIVIAYSILWLYQYGCGKKKNAIIGTSVLLLFHITAILPLGCMVYGLYHTKRRVKKSTDVFKRNYIIIIVAAFVFRFATAILLKTGFFIAIMKAILRGHASPDPTPLTFGLISRLVFLFFITYMYRASKTENDMIRLLYWYYFVSISIYIAIPMELVMGRLMNNAHILCAVLIPMLKNDIRENGIFNNVRISVKSVNLIIMMLGIVAFAILINQLMNQNGYTPYLNILLGDTL